MTKTPPVGLDVRLDEATFRINIQGVKQSKSEYSGIALESIRIIINFSILFQIIIITLIKIALLLDYLKVYY